MSLLKKSAVAVLRSLLRDLDLGDGACTGDNDNRHARLTPKQKSLLAVPLDYDIRESTIFVRFHKSGAATVSVHMAGFDPKGGYGFRESYLCRTQDGTAFAVECLINGIEAPRGLDSAKFRDEFRSQLSSGSKVNE